MTGAVMAAATAVGVRVSLPSALNAVYDDISPGNITSTLTIERDGDLIITDPGGSVDVGDWILPKRSNAGDVYEVRLVTSTGTCNGGSAVDTWLPLTSDRSWSNNVSTISPAGNVRERFTGTLQIRVPSGSIIASCPVDIDAWLHT
jgi:hypothetical protein